MFPPKWPRRTWGWTSNQVPHLCVLPYVFVSLFLTLLLLKSLEFANLPDRQGTAVVTQAGPGVEEQVVISVKGRL